MSHGLLSKLNFGHSIRTLSVVTNQAKKLNSSSSARNPEGIRNVSSLLRSATTGSHRYGVVPKEAIRFYSSKGILKSSGNMKIAIIGQSMFGQEVFIFHNYKRYLYLIITVNTHLL